MLDTGTTSGAMLELIGKTHIPTHVTLLLVHHLRAAAHYAAIMIIPAVLHGLIMPRSCDTSCKLRDTTMTTRGVHVSLHANNSSDHHPAHYAIILSPNAITLTPAAALRLLQTVHLDLRRSFSAHHPRCTTPC